VKLGRRPLAGLGPSGSGAREREKRAAAGKQAELWATVAENGPRRKEIPFLFLFLIFQSIFKRFSNPNLNLIKPLISKI
jgi:hypothetical protein